MGKKSDHIASACFQTAIVPAQKIFPLQPAATLYAWL